MAERSRFNLTHFDETKLSSYLPSPFLSPDGVQILGKHYPDCYLEAENTALQLDKLGFHFKKAGLSIAVDPQEVAVTNALLSSILDSKNMMTTIPHYFMNLSPTKIKSPLPAYCARTIISPHTSRFGVPNDPGSIIRELGASKKIEFIDKPPYCIYPKDIEKNSIPKHIIFDEILRRSPEIDVMNLNVGILAGIGKNTQEIAKKFLHENDELKVENVLHGSKVVDLARISISLLDWGMCGPEESLFFVSTARLTNEQDSIPQAYILDKLFKQLEWNPKWVGLCVIRAGAERIHPTGAMVVEIKPSQYHKALGTTLLHFNEAVNRMELANPNLFS